MPRVIALAMLLISWQGISLAAGDVVIRSESKPTEAWVGQKVVLRIDVLGKDGWAQISRLGDIQLPGAYMIRTDTQGVRLQETIDGLAYTGQRYEILIYPQRAGTIAVPAIPIEVSIKTWGADASQTVHQTKTPELSFEAKLPPGAETVQGLISTSRLTAEQQWLPVKLDAPRVGDTLQRVVTLRADDVSSMAFAPLRFSDLPGTGLYPSDPEVEDRVNRGTLTGNRTESATYVFERSGLVRIPAIELTWWDLSSEKLETIRLPGRDLEIAPGPLSTAETKEYFPSTRHTLRDIWLPAAVLLIAAILLLRYGRLLQQRWNHWRQQRLESEARCFRRVVRSVRSKDPRQALRDIMRWLDRINSSHTPARLNAFITEFARVNEQRLFDQLPAAIASGQPLADVEPLVEAIKSMRAAWLTQQTVQKADFRLPGLNP